MLWPPNASYIFQAESILFYRIFVNIWKDLGVHIIFLNFSQNNECWTWSIFTKMDVFICFDSSYSFQYESIVQDFYKYTKGVNIIRIFIFFNFPQNYGCWTLSSFIKFYIYAYTLTARLLLQFSSKYFFLFYRRFFTYTKGVHSGFLYLKFSTLYHIDKG